MPNSNHAENFTSAPESPRESEPNILDLGESQKIISSIEAKVKRHIKKMSGRDRDLFISDSERTLELQVEKLGTAIKDLTVRLQQIRLSKLPDEVAERIEVRTSLATAKRLDKAAEALLETLDKLSLVQTEERQEKVPEEDVAETMVFERIKEPGGKFEGALPEKVEGRALYGEFTSADKEHSEHNEFEISAETKFGFVAIKTSYGGEKSKYSDNPEGKKNEDATYMIATENSLIVGVIDGAGGPGNGAESSRAVSEATEKILREGGTLMNAYEAGNKALNEMPADIKTRKKGLAAGVLLRIGTTDAPQRVEMLATGDSKIMTIRGGKKLIEGTTKMQNQAALFINEDRGEDYYNSTVNNIIFGGFGKEDSMPPEQLSFDGRVGDRVVMASDGLWDVASEYEILQLSEKHPDNGEFQQAVYDLAYSRNNNDETGFVIQHDSKKTVKKTLKAGDNITVNVVRLGGEAFVEAPEKVKDKASKKEVLSRDSDKLILPGELQAQDFGEGVKKTVELKRSPAENANREKIRALREELDDARVDLELAKFYNRWLRKRRVEKLKKELSQLRLANDRSREN